MKRLAPLVGLLLAAGTTLAQPGALAAAAQSAPTVPAASGPALPDPAPAGCCGSGGTGEADDLFGGGFTKSVLLGPDSHWLDLDPDLLAPAPLPRLAPPEDGLPETRRPAEPRTWTLVLAGLGALLGIAGRRA